MTYLHARREKLGGYLPARVAQARAARRPRRRRFAQFALEANGKEMSTTVAFVRMVGGLLKDPADRQAHRADHRRRGAHLRHGRPLPPDRHLLADRPALPARGPGQLSLLQGSGRPGRSSRKASTRPARSPAGSPRRPATRRTAWRCCRCTSTTRCSASSASATRSGPLPTRARAASCSAPPPGARRSRAKACSTRTARATWSPARFPTAAPTTRASPTSWR